MIFAPRRALAGILTALTLLVGAANGIAAVGAAQPARAEAEAAAGAGTAHSRPLRHSVKRRVTVSLGSAAPELEAAKLGRPARTGAPLKIGVPRDVPALSSVAKTAATLVWELLPAGGHITALAIAAPDALGLRVGLRVHALPAAATVRFYPTGAAQAYEVSGREIADIIDRNLASGSDSEDAHTYWSPIVDGAETVVEIEVPPGVGPEQVRISLPRVSQLFALPQTQQIGEANVCNLDATCYSGTWGNESSSTARMVFTEPAGTFLCSGTLLSDTDQSTQIPYFISADHCISTQTVASTLQTYWFYRSASCNGGSVNPDFQTVAGGAALLYRSATTDTSFMRLNSSPPSGASYSGWFAGPPELGAGVTGIHHPQGDLQKISFGSISEYETCFASSGSFTCVPASASSATFVQVSFTSGITESGSSGSGLFLNNGRYLVGTLEGGSGSCGTTTDAYGRFDVAYNAALHQWLTSGSGVAPSAPTIGTATAGNSSASVSFTPASIGSGTLVNYTADCGGVAVTGSGSPITVSPLTNGVSYSCRVKTTSTVGVSDWSAPSNSVIPSGSEEFPLGGAIPAGWVRPVGANAGWAVSGDTAYVGSMSLKSSLIGNSQKAEISYTASFPAGNVSFARKVSSEVDFDLLEFYIDGVLQNSWSGDVAWSVVSFPLAAGTHTLLWRYVKDDSLFSGSDAAWIDAVVLPGAAATPVYRFFNTNVGVHFYTASELEKNTVIASYPWFRFEGTAFYAYVSPGSGRIPVYRFNNTLAGVHFYTGSEEEKNIIIASYPWYALEGVSYYAIPAAGAGVAPLYRFNHAAAGAHFYTASEEEKNSIIANLPDFAFENIAYYVRSQP